MREMIKEKGRNSPSDGRIIAIVIRDGLNKTLPPPRHTNTYTENKINIFYFGTALALSNGVPSP